MFKIFGCSHKFRHLVVDRDSTQAASIDSPKDFYIVAHHLYCTKCNSKVDIEYAKMIGGVKEYLKRR